MDINCEERRKRGMDINCEERRKRGMDINCEERRKMIRRKRRSIPCGWWEGKTGEKVIEVVQNI